MVSKVYTLREEEEEAYQKLVEETEQLYQRVSESYILDIDP